MSFWGGFARGMEDALAKRERDADRAAQDERYKSEQAWQQKMFDYRVKQDELANSLAERRLQADLDQTTFSNRMSVLELMKKKPGMLGAGTGAGAGSSSEDRSFEVGLKALKKAGASDEIVAEFAGHGPTAVWGAVDAWEKRLQGSKDLPGGAGSIDDFLTEAIVDTKPGQEPDMDKAAELMGLSKEDMDKEVYEGTGYTWKDYVRDQLYTPPSTDAYFGPEGTEPDPLDITKIRGAAIEDVDGVIQARISENIEKLGTMNRDDPARADLSAENAKLNAAKKAMKEGRPAEAIMLVGANAILPLMRNNPGSLNYSLGGDWDRAITDVTYGAEEDAFEAFKNGDLKVGDWVVVNGKILQVK